MEDNKLLYKMQYLVSLSKTLLGIQDSEGNRNTFYYLLTRPCLEWERDRKNVIYVAPFVSIENDQKRSYVANLIRAWMNNHIHIKLWYNYSFMLKLFGCLVKPPLKLGHGSVNISCIKSCLRFVIFPICQNNENTSYLYDITLIFNVSAELRRHLTNMNMI